MAGKYSCLGLIGLRGDNPTTIGTGFLIRVASQLYVISAAHLATGDRAFGEFSQWAPQVSLCPDSDGSIGRYDLFEQGVPKFRFYRNPAGQMLDMFAFPVPERPWPTRVYDFDHSPKLEKNNRITGHGFPEKGNKRQPYWPPDKIEGRFQYEVEPHAYTTLPVRTGHSGGPVLRKGALAGMMIGSDGDFGTIIPTSVLRRLFEAAPVPSSASLG